MPILERERVGTFSVIMVHSATLVNLNHADSRKLTFDPARLEGYSGPQDDIITFAYSAKFAGDSTTSRVLSVCLSMGLPEGMWLPVLHIS